MASRIKIAQDAPLRCIRCKVVPMHSDAPDRILRINIVLQRTSLSRSTLYRKMADGTFPKNIKISTRCAGWRESAVAKWLKNPMFYEAEKADETEVGAARIRPLPRLG
jgi:prophage regulatory protein